MTIIDPPDPFTPICDRLEKLGLKDRRNEDNAGHLLIVDKQGRRFYLIDVLDKLIELMERMQ